ncbi:MAG: hypothetical protein ABWW65_01035 [Thermoprotei archaeon]
MIEPEYVTTVIKTRNSDLPATSVITCKLVPKKCIEEIMRVTADLVVDAQ